jgi:hypothetical protein
MKGRHPVVVKPIPAYVVRAAARRLGFNPEGAKVLAETSHALALADAWLDTAHRYLEHARDALIVAQAPVAIERVRHAIKAVHHIRRNRNSQARLAR